MLSSADLMTSCWNPSPRSRPSFDRIVDILDTILQEHKEENEQGPGYEIPRRDQRHRDLHNYQSIIIQSDFDVSDRQPETVIDSAAARAAFESIPDPINDGYLQPRNGVMNGARPRQQQQQRQQHRSDYYNQRHADPGHDNPGYVQDDVEKGLSEEQFNSGYLKMDGAGRSKHRQNPPRQKPVRTEDIKLASKK